MSLKLPRAILFDLDGTLADTAPDLAGAVNRMRTLRGMQPAPYELLRPVASAGARGLLGVGFGIQPGDDNFVALREEFFDTYAAGLLIESRLFDGVAELLSQLTDREIVWGIVTNKSSRFSDPLVRQIGLHHSACLVSGDTTAHTKPHPEPLYEAARRIGIAPEDCWYVGDDLRDIQAGQAASMPTVAAAWGYCGNTEAASWGAEHHAAAPMDILGLLARE
jgi:2-phosphoglycolate phosphatase